MRSQTEFAALVVHEEVRQHKLAKLLLINPSC
jgi:hypothetical protein